MRKAPTFRSLAAIAALLLCVLDAAAANVGRPRGAALIGRPLNFVVPVTLDAGEQDPCVRADLFQGDSRVAGTTSRLERAADGGMQVRVASPTLLEEPVVTIYLSLGCGQQFTRRLVVLAEYPEIGAESAPVPVPVPPTAGAPTAQAPRAPAMAAPPPAPRAAAPAPAAAPVTAPPAAPRTTASPRREPMAGGLTLSPSLAGESGRSAQARRDARADARSPRRAATAEEPTAGRARLRLEPLDLSIDYSPTLKATSELLSLRPVSAQQRAEAAALWQALNMSPEDLQRQGRRVQDMEAELGRLRTSVQQNGAALAQVGQQLEKARTERNLVTLVLLVAGALLAALAALWWWKRSRESQSVGRWWHGDVATERDDIPDDSMPAPLAARRGLPSQPGSVGQPVPPAPDRGSTPVAGDAAADATPTRSGRDSGPSDFLPSHPGSMRMVKAEELIDIQQQADFFTTIGQHEQAIALLETHINDHTETSPVAWLDLLGLYHGLNRRQDYERIRDSFHERFNAQVPAFDAYRTESSGLEDYRRALSRIVALWPSPRVLEVIEESIFRKPNSPGAEPFDLQAYRDLLLLYNVAKEVVTEGAADDPGLFVRSSSSFSPRDGGPPSIGGFTETGLQPLSARRIDEPTSAGRLEPVVDIPPASPNLGLDIDLDALPPPDGEPIGGKPELPMLNFDFDLSPQERRGPDSTRH